MAVDCSVDGWSVHMLVEFCDGGSLERVILARDRSLLWKDRNSIALDIAQGMAYVHSQGYMHRDLTSSVSHLFAIMRERVGSRMSC